MESCAAARERLCDPVHEVSAHYLIDGAGRVEALVPEDRRAWHAGAGSWGGRGDVNSRSIGVELDNDGRSPFPEPQIAALVALLAEGLGRHGLGPEAVIGHSDMAPGRKVDPGPLFPWAALARAGVSIWPEGGTVLPDLDPDRVRRDLGAFGYPVDVPFETLLAAFRLRFRPGHAGPLDGRDAGLAAELARRWPVDGAARGA